MSILSNFKIEGLFGTLNVDLKLNELENIYIGENGIGKTTILSAIFNTLKGKWSELLKIDFKKIEITLDDIRYEFTKKDLKSYVVQMNNRRHGRVDIIEEEFGEEILELLPIFESNNSSRNLFSSAEYIELERKILDKIGLPKEMLKQVILRFLKRQTDGTKMIKILDERLKQYNEQYEILYFPTFRRIEEDLNKLMAFSSEEFSLLEEKKEDLSKYGELIKFGMSDVEITIKNLLDEINKKSISSFNQMTAILLKQYVNNDFENNALNSVSFDINNLEISLDRVGSEIESSYKDKIIELVKSEKIYDADNRYLLNFMKNLVKSHDPLRIIDKKIEDFVKVCNNYLVNKEYVYDASEVTLEIANNIDKRVIPLTNLSSGEKQIISTFSKIYLEYKKDFIILFDEPELSLSIDWQRKFLTDIMDSNHCKQLICVTHSPFIFEDDKLFELAKEILNEIKEVDFINSQSEIKHEGV